LHCGYAFTKSDFVLDWIGVCRYVDTPIPQPQQKDGIVDSGQHLASGNGPLLLRQPLLYVACSAPQ
jgi:hypothetical protein